MCKKILPTFFCFLILNTLCLILYTPIAGAAGLSLGVSPPILQIEAMPPASVKAPVTIQNLGEETVDLKILLKPFTAGETENGEVSYIQDGQSLPGANPLIFENMQIFDGDHSVNSVSLAPTQSKTLTFHIGVPKDEPFSDYYFSITFLSQNITNNNTNFSEGQAGISTNVLLSVGPKGKAKGEIEEFSSPLFLEKGPVPFTLRVKNTGGHFFAPTGSILIKNVFGQTVGKVDLLPVNILAGSIRAIPDSLQAPNATLSANTKYKMLNTRYPHAFWPEGFLLGPYTAALTMALSSEGPILTQTVNFVAIPLQAIIGLIIAVIFVLIIRNRLKKQSFTS